MNNNVLENYGYYKVKGKVYFNKYEAIEAALGTYYRITFHYQDTFWSAQDWLVEPRESLDTLYEKRVRQLRSKYDYLILSFSGGADTTNILQTFDKTGVHLDEIVTLHDYALSGTRNSYFGAEAWKVAVPVAESFVQKHPKTKFNFIDVKAPLIALYDKTDVDKQLTKYFHGSVTIGTSVRTGYWFYHEPRYRKLVEEGKKVCIIWGMDKTIVKKLDNRYCFWFNDYLIQYKRKGVLNLELPISDEPFYWTDDLPEIVIKQCHTVKNKLNALPLNYIDPEPIVLGSRHELFAENKRQGKASLNTVNTWLYSGWDTKTFSVGKPGGTSFVGQYDEWLVGKENEDFVQKWMPTLKRTLELFGKISPENRDRTNAYGNIGTRNSIFATKPYWLENSL